MPEILTKYPEEVKSMLEKLGAICKKGGTSETNCSSSNSCKIPDVGEFCIIGMDELDKITQFKIQEDLNGLTFRDSECNNEYKHDWLGYLAAILGPIALYTEIRHIRKTRETKGLSYIWMGLSFTVSSLWLAHSIINKIKPAAFSSIIYLFLLSNLILLKRSIEAKK